MGMHHDTMAAIVAPLRSERKKALSMVGVQAVVVVCVALGWFLFGNWTSALAVFLGGAANFVPAFLLSAYLFATLKARTGGRMALLFCLGEFVKLVVTGFAIGFVMVTLPHALVPTLIGFLASLVGLWLAPLMVKVDG